MASFRNRLKTLIFCTFVIGVLAIIVLFCYSLRYAYGSRLEIKYLGTLNLKIEKDSVESKVVSTHSSLTNPTTKASDKVHFLQESSRSKHSGLKIKTKVLAIDNKHDKDRSSNNSLTNHSADGSVALHDTYKQNTEMRDEAMAGVVSDGSNTAQDIEENLCPKRSSTLGES